MKALLLTSADGPASAAIQEMETPSPRAGEVAVALRAASLNHRELWISRGLYPGMTLPTILGADGSGIVTAVGEGVDGALIGRETVLYPGLHWGENEAFPSDRFGLLGMPGPGTITETICVPVENVFTKPAHLTHVQAAALPVAALTAFRGLTVKGNVKSGDTVLITGIGGGVATFALIFAKALGARVFVTSGSDTTLEAATAHGADGAFNYRDESWGKSLRKTAGAINMVFDGAPASAFAGYGRALAMGARVVLYGSTGGPNFTVSAPDLFLRHAAVIGTAMGSPADFGAMLDFISTHKLEPVIDKCFPFADAKDALLYLENGHHFGKVVIEMPGND